MNLKTILTLTLAVLLAGLFVSAAATPSLAYAGGNGAGSSFYAQDGGNTTSNNTTAQNGSQSLDSIRDADALIIDSPHYAGGFEKKAGKGPDALTTYTVEGEVQKIKFNAPGEVVSYSVREETGSISYDKQFDVYRLNTNGKSGTYRVSWVVSTNESRETYSANIKVENADYRHLPADRFERLQALAGLGDVVLDEYGEFCSTEDDIDACEGLMEGKVLDAWMLWVNPFQAWVESFTGSFTVLFTTPGGISALGLIIIIALMARFIGTRGARIARKQMALVGDVDDMRQRHRARERKRILSEMSFEDFELSYYHAKAARQVFGPNPWTAFGTLKRTFTDQQAAGIVFRAYEYLGYVLDVWTDDDGNVTRAELTKTSSPDADESIKPSEAGPKEYDAISEGEWPDPNVIREVPSSELMMADDIVAREPQEGDLVDQLDVQIREDSNTTQWHFETREEFADVLYEVFLKVSATEYTDEDGHVRPELDLYNMLHLLNVQMKEKYLVPLDYPVAVLGIVRDRLSSGEKLVSQADDMSGGRL